MCNDNVMRIDNAPRLKRNEKENKTNRITSYNGTNECAKEKKKPKQ